MDLRDKLIKSLERTIDLQEGLIAEQEAEIQRLEAEKAAGQWYPIQDPYKSPPQPRWPLLQPQPRWPNDFTLYGTRDLTVTGMNNEKKEQTQKGSST